MGKEQRWFRIGDLSGLTGVPRRTIHFYVQTGLLHAPVKTGKTMAYYDESHRRKLAYIQKAKGQGLPLVEIKKRIRELEKEKKSFGQRAKEEVLSKKRVQAGQRAPLRARGKKTRERIIKVGSRLFRQKGYKETKISDITRHLGIGKGSFYFYFAGKRDLFLECVPMLFGDLFSKGWEQMRKEKDPAQRLKLRAEVTVPVIKEFATILQLSKEALETEDPKLKQLGERIFVSICRPVESDIEKGIQQGMFRPVDARTVSIFLISFIQSMDYFMAIDPQLSAETLKDAVMDLITWGLRNEGSQ